MCQSPVHQIGSQSHQTIVYGAHVILICDVYGALVDDIGLRGTQPCTWPLAIPRRLDHTMRRQSHAYRFQSFCHSRGHRRRHKCESGHHNRRNGQPRRGMRRPSHTAHTQSSSHRQTPHGHRRIPAWCTPIQSAHSLKNPMR